jgi:hypothetical protein
MTVPIAQPGTTHWVANITRPRTGLSGFYEVGNIDPATLDNASLFDTPADAAVAGKGWAATPEPVAAGTVTPVFNRQYLGRREGAEEPRRYTADRRLGRRDVGGTRVDSFCWIA